MWSCDHGLPSLLVKQHLEGADQLQIGGRRDVVVSTELQLVSFRQLHRRHVELFAHVDAALALFDCQFNAV